MGTLDVGSDATYRYRIKDRRMYSDRDALIKAMLAQCFYLFLGCVACCLCIFLGPSSLCVNELKVMDRWDMKRK